jgi:hypothetical protein
MSDNGEQNFASKAPADEARSQIQILAEIRRANSALFIPMEIGSRADGTQPLSSFSFQWRIHIKEKKIAGLLLLASVGFLG